MKIEFSSQRREMLLLLTTNMAAMTSHANQQYIVACKCSEGSTEGVRVSPLAHTLKVKPSEMYVKRHATLSMIYSQTGQSEHWD